MKKIAMAVLFFAAFFSFSITTEAASGQAYCYDRDGFPQISPSPYVLDEIISLKNQNKTNISPSDMYISSDGLIYILDSENGEVAIYNQNFELKNRITSFNGSEVYKLAKPQGIFVSENKCMYIADTENHRILKSDISGNNAEIFGMPEGINELKKDSDYLPEKIVVDNDGRIFVAARSVVNGLIALSKDGKFITYIGAPKVKLDAFTAFWRKFSTQEQRNRMENYIPTEYSNIALDNEGFIYGCISAISESDFNEAILSGDISGNTTSVRRINSVGQDILRRKGTLPILGDLVKGAQSYVVDVGIGDFGTYSLLDSNFGHIFTYDQNGNLLFVFGNVGTGRGEFSRPVAIGYHESKLFILDSILSQITVFRMTDYGKSLYEALEDAYNGDFDEAHQAWGVVQELNPGLDVAYSGIGTAFLNSGEYKMSMEFYKLAGNMQGYSEAYEMYRKDTIKKFTPLIVVIIIVLLVILIIVPMIKRFMNYYKSR